MCCSPARAECGSRQAGMCSASTWAQRSSLLAAPGSDPAVLAELVPAAEAGFVEALSADADRPH